ncbi:MAG: hypothetical protein DMG10_18910 [Acidobacteria bacterium]|nr:MAG: hypothetical protein DMG10_18910 [Acidobacteriota bacterium]
MDGNWGLSDMNQQVLTSDLALGNFGQDVLGIPGTNDTSARACPEGRCGGIPYFNIAGYRGFGQVDGWSPLFRQEKSYSFTHNFSYSKSKHELRWGYDIVKLDLSHWQPEIGSGPRGEFDFNQGMTLPQGATGTDQNAYASFLLGLPNNMGKSLQWDLMTTREWQHALYFRDRWQATRNLTLTLGLRYEIYPLVRHPGGLRYYLRPAPLRPSASGILPAHGRGDFPCAQLLYSLHNPGSGDPALHGSG